MSNLFRNKIGGDKVISVYWFAILVIIAGGVFGMVYNFYGAPYDVREIEGDILANRIADCTAFQGRLNENLFNESGVFDENFEKNFFEICGLNFEVEDEHNWGSEIQYFSEIKIYDVGETELFKVQSGNLNFRSDCFIEEKSGEDYSKLVKCVEKRFYAVDYFDGDRQFLVQILVGVGKAEENVKL